MRKFMHLINIQDWSNCVLNNNVVSFFLEKILLLYQVVQKLYKILRELKFLFSKHKPGVENITNRINWISLNKKK